MKIFLDSANVEKIREAAELGLCDGVTTNPTIILRDAPGREHKRVVQEIARIVKGPVSVEGAGQKKEEIVKEGIEFSKWAKNVVVKVPITTEGLAAVKILEKKGIKTNVTLVFSVSQALLAAKVGASYVSPFVGRLDDAGQNGMEVVRDIMTAFNTYKFKTKVIVASVRSVRHVEEAAKMGAHIATIPPKVYEEMWKHMLTDRGIQMFLEDFAKAKGMRR
ncbi:MAG: fructose-6-phosphate aldolase [Candidatus Anstonellales archaeon]